MTTRWKSLALALCTLAAFPPLLAGESGKAAAKVEVLFAKPADQYVDLRDSINPSERGQAGNLDTLKRHLEQRAGSDLPPGHTLSVTLLEVDLAGDFVPHGRMGNARVIKDTYPPRIDLEFRLTGRDGKVIKEGKRELRDINFMARGGGARQQPLGYDKKLLNDWLRREFKRAK